MTATDETVDQGICAEKNEGPWFLLASNIPAGGIHLLQARGMTHLKAVGAVIHAECKISERTFGACIDVGHGSRVDVTLPSTSA